MLNFLRRGVKSLPAKVLIGLLVASFAVWGIGDIFSFRLDSRVAQVGDTEIPANRFIDDLQREQSSLSSQLGQLVTYDMMRAAGLDRRILANLVREAAYREELRELGLDAPDPAVADAIRNDPAFKDVTGNFSDQSYQFVLGRMGFSAKAFEETVRTRLARRILDETATAAVTPPPGLGPRIAAWQGEERAVTTLTLPLDMAPDPGTPDETALTAFHDANKDLFTEPERRSGEYIHVDAAKLLETLKPDEAALREHYDATKDRFTVAASRTVDQITFPDRPAAEAALGRLVAGDATFEAVGAEQGFDEASLSLGKVTPDDLPEAAAGVVFGTAEPGIVGPVDLPAGAAIFRISEVTSGGTASFEDVREQIAAEQARDALLYRAPEIANRIEELRAEGLSFAEIAEKAGADHGSFEGLARDGALPGGAKAEGVLASDTFLAEVFTALDAEERDLVETPDNGYILVMVRNIAPSELRPLDAVRDRAVTAWQTAERRKAIAARGEELAARLGQDASIWDIGEELGLAANPLPPFTQLTPPAALPPELTTALFRAPAAGGASALSADGNAAIVAQVSNIAPLSPEAIARAATGVSELLAASMQRDAREFFSRAVEAGHPATFDPGVIDEVFVRLGASGAAGQ
jgi:peptidyl-prolyl cis-trans isomerase D